VANTGLRGSLDFFMGKTNPRGCAKGKPGPAHTLPQDPASPRYAFWSALSIGVLMLGGIFTGLGLPIDTWTWGGVSIGIIPIVAAWRRGFHSICFAGATFLYYLTFFIPLERHCLQDVHGGRTGWELRPQGFRFGHAGPNTRLLERQLGPLEAQWRHSCINFILLATFRDGNERVNSRNLIFSPDLPAILEKLPTDAAREQVLICLTDPTNLLRIHQGLLLTCLKEMGYPPGMNPLSWWDKHAWVFHRERDPAEAVKVIWGWTTRLPEDRDSIAITQQLSAVHYQEQGTWGGDGALGEEFLKFEEVMAHNGKKPDSGLGMNRIEWWPK
jgi:hypothetical protein